MNWKPPSNRIVKFKAFSLINIKHKGNIHVIKKIQCQQLYFVCFEKHKNCLQANKLALAIAVHPKKLRIKRHKSLHANSASSNKLQQISYCQKIQRSVNCPDFKKEC